jgi:hypothetical protein
MLLKFLKLLGIDTALGFDVVGSQRKDQPHILKIIIIIKTKQLFQFSSTLFWVLDGDL